MRTVSCTSALIAGTSSAVASRITRSVMIHPSRRRVCRSMLRPLLGRLMTKSTMLAAVAALTVAAPLMPAGAADPAAIARGKYLVAIAGCNDCHTPVYFLGKPDETRFLGGSEVGFEIPGLGVFHGPNLTPDKDTGIGTWSEADIVKLLRTGERPDGRELAPIMPWKAFAQLTDYDVRAIAAYLKSLPALSNKVPGPFGPSGARPDS